MPCPKMNMIDAIPKIMEDVNWGFVRNIEPGTSNNFHQIEYYFQGTPSLSEVFFFCKACALNYLKFINNYVKEVHNPFL